MHNTNRCIPSGVSALPRVDMSLLAWPVMLAPGVRGFEEGLPRVQTDCLLFSATGKRDSGTSETLGIDPGVQISKKCETRPPPAKDCSQAEETGQSGLKVKRTPGEGHTSSSARVVLAPPMLAAAGSLLPLLQPQQNGISPRMFKAFVSKSHPEFSSNRQQDAQEFFLHLVNLVERNRIGSENPSDVFRFLVEERIQCCQTRKVRYTERVDYLMQLPVAMEAATNKDELIAYELTRREAEANRRPLPELVRAKIPFSACLQAFSEPENVDDFWSSALQAKSADVSIDMPDLLDINHLRARGLQPGEEELPDISPPVVIPDSKASDIDESSVMQLAEMGFPLEACRKAVYFTGNMGAEVAFNWIIVHMEEPVLTCCCELFSRESSYRLRLGDLQNVHGNHPEFEEDSDFVIEMENNANANIISEAKPEGPRVKDGSGKSEPGSHHLLRSGPSLLGSQCYFLCTPQTYSLRAWYGSHTTSLLICPQPSSPYFQAFVQANP
ncbi:Ubiquitin carboxyl-terminal hydrolase 13, partial [Eschrichtius robustus]|nr:Ubiquitin carboxyl-terminal hydrolase 13 [Eschrichtius robustus]